MSATAANFLGMEHVVSSSLPADVREKLAELDLELSEGIPCRDVQIERESARETEKEGVRVRVRERKRTRTRI